MRTHHLRKPLPWQGMSASQHDALKHHYDVEASSTVQEINCHNISLEGLFLQALP